jgi:biotin/methionine sulfoxide reductase
MAGRRTMISSTWSLQRAEHGEQPYWMTVVLAAMLGQIGLPGGGFGFGYGNSAGIGQPRAPFGSPELPALVNPTKTHIPVARIADLLLNPGGKYDFDGKQRTYPDIHLVYWAGGNPFHHHQDLNRLIRAWQKPETIVIHEPWWTPTARYADIVLPATTSLERNDIGASSRDRYVIAMRQAVDPVGASRNDHDILAGLAERLGIAETFTEGRDEMGWLRFMYDTWRSHAAEYDVVVSSFEEFWERGHEELPAPAVTVAFSEFRADPEGARLKTPSGKIEIFSEAIDAFGYADCPGHPVWLAPREWLGSSLVDQYPLHLVSHQPAARLHSQLDMTAVSQESKIGGREPCTMHPDDAGRRGIKSGDVVRLFNDRGQCLAGAIVSEDILPRVVLLATGAWYDPVEPGRPGSLDRHGNPNMLTDDRGTSRLGQGPSAHSALIEVERYSGTAAEPNPFEPPLLIGARAKE